MLGGILKILIVIGLVAGATYLIPNDVKHNIATKLGSMIGSVMPDSVKKKMEPVVFTPAERRQKLLDQLQKNIDALKADLAKSTPLETKILTGRAPQGATSSEVAEDPETTPEDIVQKLEETQKIIEEIEEINNEGGVVNKITTKIYKSVTGGGSETSETCSCEAK